MFTILMISAKMASLGLLKKKCFEIKVTTSYFVYDVYQQKLIT